MPFTGHHAHTYAHAQTHKHAHTQKPALHMPPNLHDNQLPFIVLHHAGKPLYSLRVKEKESEEKESRRFVCFRVCFCILRATAHRLFSSDCVFERKCLAMFWQSSGSVLDLCFSFTHTHTHIQNPIDVLLEKRFVTVDIWCIHCYCTFFTWKNSFLHTHTVYGLDDNQAAASI